MKFVRIIDTQGSFIEDALVEELTEFTIETPVPDGFYLPKWNGTKWVEGGSAPDKSTEQHIEELKSLLTSTDYKIIKCSECQLVGEELPYDIIELRSERQAARDKINELEAWIC